MPDIALARPLKLTMDDGTVHEYPAGFHKGVPTNVADHWYTKLHLVPDNERSTADAIAEGREGPDASVGFLAQIEGLQAANNRLTDELQRVSGELTAERATHEETRRLLDEATAPDDDEGGREVKGDGVEYAVQHRGRGTYAVMKGEEIVEDGLTKSEAEAKAAERNKA